MQRKKWSAKEWGQKLQDWKKIVRNIPRNTHSSGGVARFLFAISEQESLVLCDPNLLYDVCYVSTRELKWPGNFITRFYNGQLGSFNQSLTKDRLLQHLIQILSTKQKEEPIYYAAYVCLKLFGKEMKNTSFLYTMYKNSGLQVFKSFYLKWFGNTENFNVDELKELKVECLKMYDDMLQRANTGREIFTEKNNELKIWQVLALAADNNVSPYAFEFVAALKFNSPISPRSLHLNVQNNENIPNKLAKIYLKKMVPLLKSYDFVFAAAHLLEILIPSLTCQKDLNDNMDYVLRAIVFAYSKLKPVLDQAIDNFKEDNGEGLKKIATVLMQKRIKDITEIEDVKIEDNTNYFLFSLIASSGKAEINPAEEETIKLKMADVLKIIIKAINNKEFTNKIVAQLTEDNKIKVKLLTCNHKYINTVMNEIDNKLVNHYTKLKYATKNNEKQYEAKEDTYVEVNEKYIKKKSKTKSGFNHKNINTSIEIMDKRESINKVCNNAKNAAKNVLPDTLQINIDKLNQLRETIGNTERQEAIATLLKQANDLRKKIRNEANTIVNQYVSKITFIENSIKDLTDLTALAEKKLASQNFALEIGKEIAILIRVYQNELSDLDNKVNELKTKALTASSYDDQSSDLNPEAPEFIPSNKVEQPHDNSSSSDSDSDESQSLEKYLSSIGINPVAFFAKHFGDSTTNSPGTFAEKKLN